jgi:hypothetical protein
MKFIITEEQSEKLNHKIKSTINKYGLDHSIELFGDKEVIRRAYQDNPLSFLNQFNDLTPVEKDDKIYYVDKDRLPLIMYYPDRKNGDVFINYGRIWSFIVKVFGFESTKIQKIIKKWLKDTYNLSGLTPLRGGVGVIPII